LAAAEKAEADKFVFLDFYVV